MYSVIFDLDGTLLDSMDIWRNTGGMYLRSLGIEAESGLADILLPLTITQGAEYVRQKYLPEKSVEEIAAGVDSVIEDAYFRDIQPKEGARELLRALSLRGIPATVATATDRYLVEAALARLDFAKYISRIFTCREVGVGKKDGPQIYFAAAQSMGASPENCWVFEDMPHAARTAAAAGFMVAGVRDMSGGDKEARLRPWCDLYFEKLAPTDSVLSALDNFKR